MLGLTQHQRFLLVLLLLILTSFLPCVPALGVVSCRLNGYKWQIFCDGVYKRDFNEDPNMLDGAANSATPFSTVQDPGTQCKQQIADPTNVLSAICNDAPVPGLRNVDDCVMGGIVRDVQPGRAAMDGGLGSGVGFELFNMAWEACVAKRASGEDCGYVWTGHVLVAYAGADKNKFYLSYSDDPMVKADTGKMWKISDDCQVPSLYYRNQKDANAPSSPRSWAAEYSCDSSGAATQWKDEATGQQWPAWERAMCPKPPKVFCDVRSQARETWEADGYYKNPEGRVVYLRAVPPGCKRGHRHQSER